MKITHIFIISDVLHVLSEAVHVTVWKIKLTSISWNLKIGVGVILCIEKALAHAGVSRGDINYINAHATSTPTGDIKEYQALLHCFGDNPEVISRTFLQKLNLHAYLFFKFMHCDYW